MAKAKQQPLSCKTKRKRNESELGNFSESEIDAAEQLIQLSGDSDSTNINGSNHREEEIISDCDTTHVLKTIFKHDDDDDQDHCFRKINGRDRDDRTLYGSGSIRKNKRFKPLSEIYSLTKPLSNIIINHR